jgi:hypothetical protein
LATAQLGLASPSHALGNEGALALGHGRANLQEQLIVRIIAHRSLDKLDATAPLGQFIDQEHLMHIVASQAIGRDDHDAFNGRHCDAISEAVETGAFEGGTTIAVIAVDVLVGDMPVGAGRDVGTETVQLLVNRLLLLLTGC